MGSARWAVAVVALVLVLAVVAARPYKPVELQPRPDAQSYAQLADALARLERPTVEIVGEPEGSRYPPGFPVMVAPFRAVGVPVERVAQVFTGLVVVLCWAFAWRLRGPVAAAVAVMVLATSRPFIEQSAFVMTDITSAGLLVGACWLTVEGRDRAAGWVLGWALWVRLSFVAAAVALRRRGWVPFLIAGAGLVVAKLVLGFGYRGQDAEWALANVWSPGGIITDPGHGNLVGMARMLLGFDAGLVLPGVVPFAAWAAWRETGGRWALRASAGLLFLYLPYFYQAPRFLFPVVALTAVYAGAGLASLLGLRQGAPHLDLAEHQVVGRA